MPHCIFPFENSHVVCMWDFLRVCGRGVVKKIDRFAWILWQVLPEDLFLSFRYISPGRGSLRSFMQFAAMVSQADSNPTSRSDNVMSETITEFFVQGMKCGGCIGNAEKALVGVPGFVSAEFDLDAAIARVVGEVDPQAVCQALTEAGYPAVVKSV